MALGSLVVAAGVATGLALPAQVAVPGGAAAAGASPGRQITVDDQLLVCPDLRLGPADSTVSLLVPTATKQGRVIADAGALGAASALGQAGALGTAGPGLTVMGAPEDPAPVIVRARGAGAAGVVAGRRTLAFDGGQRGLSVLACPAPERETWFVGSGSLIGRRGQLELINPTAAAVVVDVNLAGPDGPLRAPAGRGVVLASGARVVLKLDGLVPDVPVLAVHVLARTGRVAVALRDEESVGITQPAIDWVPAAAAPARTVVVPGVVRLPEDLGARTLHVFVPGPVDAVARLRLLGTGGPVKVEGLDVVRLRAGRVTTVDLAAVGNDQSVGIEIAADVPLTAGVQVRRAATPGGPADQAWTAAVLPSQAGTVLASPLLPATSSSGLLVSAPGAAARVEVTILTAGAAPEGNRAVRRYSVPAGGTLLVSTTDLLAGRDGALTVRSLAGSPPYVAGISVAGGRAAEPLLALTPLVARPSEVAVPGVTLDLWAGVHRDP